MWWKLYVMRQDMLHNYWKATVTTTRWNVDFSAQQLNNVIVVLKHSLEAGGMETKAGDGEQQVSRSGRQHDPVCIQRFSSMFWFCQHKKRPWQQQPPSACTKPPRTEGKLPQHATHYLRFVICLQPSSLFRWAVSQPFLSSTSGN